MRHRDEGTQPSRTVVNGVTGTLAMLTEMLAEETPTSGKHRQHGGDQRIPEQKQRDLRDHEAAAEAAAEAAVQVPAEAAVQVPAEAAVEAPHVEEVVTRAEAAESPARLRIVTQPTADTVDRAAEPAEPTQERAEEVLADPSVVHLVEPVAPTGSWRDTEVTHEVAPEVIEQWAPHTLPGTLPAASVPAQAQWKASHGPRMFAAALLLLAVAGTSALGLRYAETRAPDALVSLVIGAAVIVGLWALLIASTPQVITLRASVLTVRNSSGTERFDLADGLQPVDVVGEPGSSQWAVLLHRSDNTSVVLRRRDVDAFALDPIVRHYRAIAERRYANRNLRFNR